MPAIEPNNTADQKPCRTCVDFKTWAKQQRKSPKQQVNHFTIASPRAKANLSVLHPGCRSHCQGHSRVRKRPSEVRVPRGQGRTRTIVVDVAAHDGSHLPRNADRPTERRHQIVFRHLVSVVSVQQLRQGLSRRVSSIRSENSRSESSSKYRIVPFPLQPQRRAD